jgi:hypothetical protein
LLTYSMPDYISEYLGYKVTAPPIEVSVRLELIGVLAG